VGAVAVTVATDSAPPCVRPLARISNATTPTTTTTASAAEIAMRESIGGFHCDRLRGGSGRFRGAGESSADFPASAVGSDADPPREDSSSAGNDSATACDPMRIGPLSPTNRTTHSRGSWCTGGVWTG
jgi:hypothetical protein